MKWVDEFRGADRVRQLADLIQSSSRTPAAIMEVCGGQTHAILRFGLDQLLPPHLELLHGPGCPVCVTPARVLDFAIELCERQGILLCTFGDMVRVPGSQSDLLHAKARGGDVRMVYSPLDAVQLARDFPDREVVFLAVGFETTAPANAMATMQARTEGLRNFSLLVSQVLVPPAISALLGAPGCRIRGFLAAGHVCTVTGYAEYAPLAARFHVPMVVTGFEPVDLLCGILQCVRQIEEGRADVENAYPRAVKPEGNLPARKLLDRVFQVCDREWRGIGMIPLSGWELLPEFAQWDAEKKFSKIFADLPSGTGESTSGCRSGEVLQGLIKPPQCPAFGSRCTPENPLGATMVSSEGACAAYFRYSRSQHSPP